VLVCKSFINLLKPRCYFIYHHVQHSNILHFAYIVYLCVLCVSEEKQRLLPYTPLTDWFLLARWRVFTARYEWNPKYNRLHFVRKGCMYLCTYLIQNVWFHNKSSCLWK
jgi:hypothetical protein